MRLQIVETDGMVNIHSDTDGISYAVIPRMYKTGDGEGLQINDESRRDAIATLCRTVCGAIRQYNFAIKTLENSQSPLLESKAEEGNHV